MRVLIYTCLEVSTRPILRSLVSSHRADVYKCTSVDADSYLSPPYACAFSNDAKRGGTPLLAVATEQGSVHILNTSRRQDWDPEPPRTTLQPHHNGVFAVKWDAASTRLATASGDHSARVSCAATGRPLALLLGHAGTVKCVEWDPQHADLLCTGGRDGELRIWDLRVAMKEGRAGGAVLAIKDAHEDVAPRRGRRPKSAPKARSVTNVLFLETEPCGIVSSGSFDGILRHWDIRLPTTGKRVPGKAKHALVNTSPTDPTLTDTRRPRGITSFTRGVSSITHSTGSLLFALSADARIHTYHLPSLQPLGSVYAGINDTYADARMQTTSVSRTQTTSFSRMQTTSFYVHVAASPCGRWLASGCAQPRGSAFLWDVGNAGRVRGGTTGSSGRGVEARGQSVELRGQSGEVGAVDWAADGVLATCADDGTVRVWRPDVERYRTCVREPEEAGWEWSWSVG
ncbi:hypothetical protein PLICRDRAFT_96930 [Plicaturopsis crispa FD-325 SS-3]|nr:hypothetical protein PLICRDRAFT_96930 [Plicaturopsis crispa FD-325 SS-3]